MRSRGQANLLALAVSLLLVTTAVGAATVAATGAFASERRTPAARAAAVTVSDRLVSSDGPLAVRENVLSARAANETTPARLRRWFPGAARRGLRVTLDGRTLAQTGDGRGGATVERLVRVERRGTAVVPDAFANATRFELDRRTRRIDVEFAPRGDPVYTLWVDGRVALHDPGGLDGHYVVRSAGVDPPTLAVDGRPRRPGSVRVTSHPLTAEPGVLRVVVGD